MQHAKLAAIDAPANSAWVMIGKTAYHAKVIS